MMHPNLLLRYVFEFCALLEEKLKEETFFYIRVTTTSNVALSGGWNSLVYLLGLHGISVLYSK